jgi:N-acyl-D-aspartate/D-glutamate deacylase
MKIGPYELQVKELKDSSWEFRIFKDGSLEMAGYRKTETEARNAGLEDAGLLRQHCR